MAIDLLTYLPGTQLGLTDTPDRVRQHLIEEIGPFPWIEGFRGQDGTEHFTRLAVDYGINVGDWRRGDRLANYLVEHWRELGVEGVIWNRKQTGYGYSAPGTWIGQMWRPPPGFQGDPFHERHVHVKVRPDFRPASGGGGVSSGAFDSQILLCLYTNPGIDIPDITPMRAQGFARPLKNSMQKFGIISRNQVTHFLTHLAYESGCLNWFEEFGGPSQAVNLGYNGGRNYYGRGRSWSRTESRTTGSWAR